MRGKEKKPIAYLVFQIFLGIYSIENIGKGDWFLWWQNFCEWYLHFIDINKVVSPLSLSGCTSYLNNNFLISDNSKNKKVYLVEYSMFLTVLGYIFQIYIWVNF